MLRRVVGHAVVVKTCALVWSEGLTCGGDLDACKRISSGGLDMSLKIFRFYLGFMGFGPFGVVFTLDL